MYGIEVRETASTSTTNINTVSIELSLFGKIPIKDINLNQSKIEIIVTDIDTSILEELHKDLIKN